MPAEIKLECIERMEFRERLSLRCTAKAEKSLVDSQKMHFTEGLFLKNSITVASKNETSLTRNFKDEKIWLNSIQFFLKIGVFDKISFLVGDKLNTTVDDFLSNCTEQVSAKNIDFGEFDMKTAMAFLQKVGDGVESICFDAFNQMWFSLDGIFLQSHVQNASYGQIKNLMFLGCVQKVAQMWIDKNSKIGSTFQVSVVIGGSFDSFVIDFADCIVSQTEDRIRIRSNNPEKHILLERGEVIEHMPFLEFYRLMVISAEMKESEYDDDCETWMRRMHPEQFFDSDSDDSRYDDYYDYSGDEVDNEDIFGRHVDDIDEDWHGNYYM
ncbi:unnamed protein product [Caenorhabditis nigoni]